MPLLKVHLDPISLKQLTDIAVSERRPIALQAEVLLLKALDRWPVPEDDGPPTEEHVACASA
jgi:hypothetical protein